MSLSLLEVNGLTKSYRGREVLSDVSFSVAPGDVVGFVGPNGAGKTSTISIALGLIDPDRGTARVLGEPYAELVDPARRVGVLLDASWIDGRLKVRDIVRLGARAKGFETEGIVDAALDRVDLTAVAGQRVMTLSMGQRQRLGLAVALLGEPELFVFDEPVTGLDPAGISWFRGLLAEVRARGAAALVSSHLLAELETVATRVVGIKKGRIVFDEPVDRVRQAGGHRVQVAADAALLAATLAQTGATVRSAGDEMLDVDGVDAEQISRAATALGLVVIGLGPRTRTIDEFYRAHMGDAAYAEAPEAASGPAVR